MTDPNTTRTPTTRPAARHRAPNSRRPRVRLSRYLLHPAGHVLTLLFLHIVALAVLAAADDLPILSTVLH